MIFIKVMIIICLIPLTCIQCVEQENQKNDDPMKMMNKKPKTELHFSKLMSIEDLSKFKSFISAPENKNVILRIPLTAIYEGSKVFGPDHYFIGDSKGVEGEMKLDLNDTRMGIGVKSHLLNGCEEDLCTFWIDLQWQGMDGKHARKNDDGLFEVMAIDYKEDSDELDRDYVYSVK